LGAQRPLNQSLTGREPAMQRRFARSLIERLI
jgi:hypothetical protein